ncbi:dephospho-CoA kinase [Kozakia baliensis]|uniref:dephospho-CoA kinase n=1 Tax=Kozakia baliensis TaxID=153496 RepID=UPI0004962168|nr:dephospho-CoA kinase [Kozakia baliensis]
MRVLGLTGGMGAGKTTVANIFRRSGWPVFDADATVHRLQAKGGAAIGPIAAQWPQTVRDGAVDRAALRQAVIGHPDQMRLLEQIIHPLVRQARTRFLRQALARKAPWCALDIPLLFETGAERECDVTLVVTAPLSVRLQRIMRRRSITETQARALVARQMNDTERQKRADIVIRTGLSRRHTLVQVRKLQRQLEKLP